MTAYYNEFDPAAAAWLRELIAQGHIAPGVVDERSIEDVKPSDLEGFTQCHFFAGIGVWSYALRRAGWDDSRPVWTGSCPCQPFSAAGAGAGFDDERHLWPSFAWLIAQCKPAVVFGEQVASKAVEPWVDLVHADLEAMGYAFGTVPFPSAGVGAPHIRDRLYWVAKSDGLRLESAPISGIHDAEHHVESCGSVERLADSPCSGWREKCPYARGSIVRDSPQGRPTGPEHGCSDLRPGPVNGFWRAADWLGCRDDKWRPVEPGTFPLAHGAAARVGRLRGYGNAINSEAAKVFIEAFMNP